MCSHVGHCHSFFTRISVSSFDDVNYPFRDVDRINVLVRLTEGDEEHASAASDCGIFGAVFVGLESPNRT